MRPLVILALALALAPGCAALKKNVWTGGSAAAGGAVGALLGGPLGAALGAGMSAVIFSATMGEEEYRSGDSLTKEALERELARWRNDAWAAEQRAREIEQQSNKKIAETRTWAESVEAAAKTTVMWTLIIGALYFVVRNREHIFVRGPGYFRRLWHSIVGGKRK